MSGPDDARTSPAAAASLLAPARPSVGEQVLHSFDHPEAYLRDHAGRPADRGIDEPVPDLAWIALVDAPADHRLLAELDWKEDPQEVRSQLRGLDPHPSVDPWVLVGEDDMLLPADEFLRSCGRHYADVGAAPAVLDIEFDCYPVVCLRAARVQELTALAQRAGFTAWALGVRWWDRRGCGRTPVGRSDHRAGQEPVGDAVLGPGQLAADDEIAAERGAVLVDGEEGVVDFAFGVGPVGPEQRVREVFQELFATCRLARDRCQPPLGEEGGHTMAGG